ncbi:hypothetical protein CCHR01_04604 [Colletotrichum chrysophilum]|uniref:Uncharacterized protein n=1 Tax=Colletotrichum chrysophilum TaxID=1836956 RepID=A0AAD9ELI7_9PEZI|nr:hypothetical protein CCHR01_04604 [Colletotrichum chrysophilum]
MSIHDHVQDPIQGQADLTSPPPLAPTGVLQSPPHPASKAGLLLPAFSFFYSNLPT